MEQQPEESPGQPAKKRSVRFLAWSFVGMSVLTVGLGVSIPLLLGEFGTEYFDDGSTRDAGMLIFLIGLGTLGAAGVAFARGRDLCSVLLERRKARKTAAEAAGPA